MSLWISAAVGCEWTQPLEGPGINHKVHRNKLVPSTTQSLGQSATKLGTRTTFLLWSSTAPVLPGALQVPSSSDAANSFPHTLSLWPTATTTGGGGVIGNYRNQRRCCRPLFGRIRLRVVVVGGGQRKVGHSLNFGGVLCDPGQSFHSVGRREGRRGGGKSCGVMSTHLSLTGLLPSAKKSVAEQKKCHWVSERFPVTVATSFISACPI